MLTYGQLPQRDRAMKTVNSPDGPILVSGSSVFLYCPECDARYSATRGDYFMCADTDPISPCECGGEMILATERRTIEQVA